MNKTIKELLIEAINTENRLTNVRDNISIIKKYKSLDYDPKDTVNSIFIDICGYSLETLIIKSSAVDGVLIMGGEE